MPVGEECESAQVQLLRHGNDLDVRVRLDGPEQFDRGAAMALFRQGVADLKHDGAGGEKVYVLTLDPFGEPERLGVVLIRR